MDVIKWLLEDDTPGVAYLVRKHLLGEDISTRRMKSLRRRCNEAPPVARMLDHVDDAIEEGDYRKYRGAYWTLIFLADLQVDGRDKRVRKLADHVLDAQLDNGGFSATAQKHFEIVCLTANLLRALVHCGFGEDDRVIRGYRRLAERILGHHGVPCVVIDQMVLTSCMMTIPQTLRCLAVAPKGTPRKKIKETRDLLVKQLLGVHVFRYVRPDAKAFYAAAKKRPKGTTVRQFRARWLAQHNVNNKDLLAKPGWLRFGFPQNYNPDLLEAMLALAELGAKHTRAMDDALDHIESRRGDDGRWILNDSLNGKTWASVECKGRPSKWITLRALIVLGHFRRIDI